MFRDVLRDTPDEESIFRCGNCHKEIFYTGQHFNKKLSRYECCDHKSHKNKLVEWLNSSKNSKNTVMK